MTDPAVTARQVLDGVPVECLTYAERIAVAHVHALLAVAAAVAGGDTNHGGSARSVSDPRP